MPRPLLPSRARAAADRGSVLITALILSAIIAISLTSYIKLALNSLSLADRSFYQNAAVNLTEVGIEEALYCYNQLDNVATATSAWPSPWVIGSDNSVTRTLALGTLGPGVTAEVKVYCSAYNPASTATPVVVSKSIITFARGGSTITKFMEVTLKKRSLFVNGLVAKDGIEWDGHPIADSWNSDPDGNPATTMPYAVGNRTANCTVGAVTGNIDLGSGGDVYGYAKTGTSGSTSGGSVHGLGTTTNDTSRITKDLAANFPTITTPTPTTINIISGTVPSDFPTSSHSKNTADNVYYFSFASGKNISDDATIGDSIPNAKVVMIMNNHQNVDAISFSGGKSLTVKTGSTLTIYTNGNITATGNGMVNGTTAGQNPSSSLIIYGTTISPSTQEIKVGGNGQLYAAIYAPQGNVEMKGGGSSGMVLGSVVAKSISMNGGTDFHYDEALANLGTGNPFGIIKWRELQSASERTSYAAQLNF
jgi:hypothetical protein